MKRIIFPNQENPFASISKSGGSYISTVIKKVKVPKVRIPFKWIGIGFGVLLVLLVVFSILSYVFIARPVLEIASDLKKVKGSTYQITSGLKDLNLKEIKTGLNNTKTELASFRTKFEKNSKLLRKLPKGEIYYQDSQHLINAANESIGLGELTISIIEPYAEDLGLATNGNSAKQVPAQDRVIKLMRLMPEFSPKVSEISSRMQVIDKELNSIDAKNYPQELPWIVTKFGIDKNLNIREQILDIQSITHEFAQKAPQFESLFNAIPEFMGLNTPKKYLIVMANNYELRMAGGFNTYIIAAEFKEGIPDITYQIDTYFIDEGQRTGSSALVVRDVPYHLRNYLYLPGNTFRWYARDATSNNADFPLAADDLINRFWVKDRFLPQNINGVISINNDVAVDILNAVGPVKTDKYSIRRDNGTYVTIPDTEFTGDNVILELENIAGGKLAETIGRKEIINYLAQSILTKIYTSEATNLIHIARVGLDSMTKKDVMLYSFDPTVQSAFESMGYSGRISQEPEGADYLHVNRSNYGSGKADWTKPGFVSQDVKKSIEVVDGKKISKVEVTIKNPKRPEWFNIDPCCFYNAYMRVYVPLGSKMISVTSSDGQNVNGAQFDDEAVKKTYIESYSKQLKETELTLTYIYQLPDNVNLDDYKILVQRQSGSTVDPYSISVNGVSTETLLNSDKLLEIN